MVAPEPMTVGTRASVEERAASGVPEFHVVGRFLPLVCCCSEDQGEFAKLGQGPVCIQSLVLC